MYENRRQGLAPKKVYYQRIGRNALIGIGILLVCLVIGVIGFKFSVHAMDWADSLMNASLILSGMGPAFKESWQFTTSAKIFVSVYTIFSGMAFYSIFGFIIAPVAHRFLHRIHLEEKESNNE